MFLLRAIFVLDQLSSFGGGGRGELNLVAVGYFCKTYQYSAGQISIQILMIASSRRIKGITMSIPILIFTLS